MDSYMKKYVWISLLFPALSFGDENPCGNVKIGPSGMAWEVGMQGQLATGLVTCNYENYERKTLYHEGYKHGIENIYELKGYRREITNHYRHGELLESCRSKKVSTGKMVTFCENMLTNETYIRKSNQDSTVAETEE